MSTRNDSKRGCLTVVLGLFGIGKSQPSTYPYRVRDDFLSNAERSFYGVLKLAVGERAIIFSKVGLWDIFYVARPHEHRRAKPHIDRKHVDFLLCDLNIMQPIVALELDDASHQREDRKARDAAVNAVFETAQLPLLRIPVSRGYNRGDLETLLAPYLGNGEIQPAAPKRNVPPASVQVDSKGAPLCPKCETPMVIRVTKRGKHQGEQFYGCPNYPKCKRIIPLKS